MDDLINGAMNKANDEIINGVSWAIRSNSPESRNNNEKLNQN